MQLKMLHILLVEDSRATAAPIIAYLEQGGHRVTHVTSGEAAIDAYRAETPDMVLMDVVMPGIGGFEATRRIKAIRTERWVPLIMATGLNATEDLITGLEAGADDYMFKPIHLDVLEARMRSMQRIAAIQTTLATLVGSVIEGIIRIDARGTVVTFNSAAERIFGYEAKEVLGRNVRMLMPAPYAESHDGYLTRYLSSREPHIIGHARQVVGLRKNGETFPMSLGVTDLITPEGQSFIGLVRDVSGEMVAQARVEYMAWHDALTGLPNRAKLWNELQEVMAANHAQALLFLDLDGFKQINDTHGHAMGDRLLREVAARLQSSLPHEDLIARLGGDEFVLLLRGVDDAGLALAVAGRLIEELSQPIVIDDKELLVGVSIGVALAQHCGKDAQALLAAADAAMYKAKQAGRGRAVLAETE